MTPPLGHTLTLPICAAVPRRARIEGSQTCVSLDSTGLSPQVKRRLTSRGFDLTGPAGPEAGPSIPEARASKEEGLSCWGCQMLDHRIWCEPYPLTVHTLWNGFKGPFHRAMAPFKRVSGPFQSLKRGPWCVWKGKGAREST